MSEDVVSVDPPPTRLWRRSRAAGRRHVDGLLATVVLVLDVLLFSDLGGGLDNTANGDMPAFLVVAFAAAGCVPLVWRRRAPVIVFLVLLAHAVLGAFVPRYQPFIGLLVALYAVGAYRSAACWWTVPAAVIPYGMVSWDQVSTEVTPADRPVAMASLMVLYVVLTAVVWSAGRWVGHSRRRTADLERRRAEDARAAVATERARVARELHDIVAHSVTVMVMQAGGAERVIDADPGRAKDAMRQVQIQGKQAMSELRRMLVLLRAPDGSAVPHPDLADLEQLIATVREAGLPVTLRRTGEPAELDPSVALAVFRVIQEALTNVAKHAADATSVVVRVIWSDVLTVQVFNDGGERPAPGLAGLSTGHGLLGLNERVTVVGGSFAAGPLPGGGFAVTALLPVRKASPGTAAAVAPSS